AVHDALPLRGRWPRRRPRRPPCRPGTTPVRPAGWPGRQRPETRPLGVRPAAAICPRPSWQASHVVEDALDDFVVADFAAETAFERQAAFIAPDRRAAGARETGEPSLYLSAAAVQLKPAPLDFQLPAFQHRPPRSLGKDEHLLAGHREV